MCNQQINILYSPIHLHCIGTYYAEFTYLSIGDSLHNAVILQHRHTAASSNSYPPDYTQRVQPSAKDDHTMHLLATFLLQKNPLSTMCEYNFLPLTSYKLYNPIVSTTR